MSWKLSKGDWAVVRLPPDPKKPDAPRKTMPWYPWVPLKEGYEWDAFSITGWVMFKLQAVPTDDRVQEIVSDLCAHLGRPPEVFNDDIRTSLDDVKAALHAVGVDTSSAT